MAKGYNLIELDGHVVFKMLPLIHEKKDFCGGDGYLRKKKLAENLA